MAYGFDDDQHDEQVAAFWDGERDEHPEHDDGFVYSYAYLEQEALYEDAIEAGFLAQLAAA